MPPHGFLPPRPYSMLIQFISNPEAPSWWGFLLAGLMFVCALVQTLILHQYYHCIFVSALRVRTGVIGVIYRKVSGSPALHGDFPGAVQHRLTSLAHPVLSPGRRWSSPTQSNVSPQWEK